MTLGAYAQAVLSIKSNAQAIVAALFAQPQQAASWQEAYWTFVVHAEAQ